MTAGAPEEGVEHASPRIHIQGETSTRLGNNSRTVSEHLEHIFEKLAGIK